jgi:hypothetical protein
MKSLILPRIIDLHDIVAKKSVTAECHFARGLRGASLSGSAAFCIRFPLGWKLKFWSARGISQASQGARLGVEC